MHPNHDLMRCLAMTLLCNGRQWQQKRLYAPSH